MTFNGTNLRTHTCPECEKYRLYLPIGETPSLETEIKDLPNGEKRAFYKQMCDFCKVRIHNKFFKPKRSDIKKVIKALKDGKTCESLENLL